MSRRKTKNGRAGRTARGGGADCREDIARQEEEQEEEEETVESQVREAGSARRKELAKRVGESIRICGRGAERPRGVGTAALAARRR